MAYHRTLCHLFQGLLYYCCPPTVAGLILCRWMEIVWRGVDCEGDLTMFSLKVLAGSSKGGPQMFQVP